MKNKVTNIYFILEIVFGIIGSVFTIFGGGCMLILLMPSDSELDAVMLILSTVFLAIGLTFLVVTIILACTDGRRKKEIRNLIEAGRYVWARVDNITIKYNVQVNRAHPYVIECFYEDPVTGEKHRFKSEFLFADPAYYLDKDIRVFVDNRDYTCYYVEVDENKLFPINY